MAAPTAAQTRPGYEGAVGVAVGCGQTLFVHKGGQGAYSRTSKHTSYEIIQVNPYSYIF